ncbi:hypothetical protein CE91St48_22350 [Emergencia timonensis]|nr:hypothetical protein CE91St48_22350 [Emergencia timonensis]
MCSILIIGAFFCEQITKRVDFYSAKTIIDIWATEVSPFNAREKEREYENDRITSSGRSIA